MNMTQESDNRMSAGEARVGRRSHFWSILLGAGILLFGMVIGACLTLFFVRGRVMRMIRSPEARSRAMLQRLDRALDLTEEQREEVAGILREHRKRFNDIRREMGPRIRDEVDSLEEEVAQVLDDDQKKKWGRYVKRMRQVWLSRFQRNKRGKRIRAPNDGR